MAVTHVGPSPLRLCRIVRGLSQAQLADLAGVRRETVSKLERGADPGLRTARALADALRIDVVHLFPVNDAAPAGGPTLVTTSPMDGGRDVERR